jgi:pilus assembly protein CpaE
MAVRKYRIKIAVGNSAAVKDLAALLKADQELEAVDLKSNDPVDLMIIELNDTGPEFLEKIEALQESKKATEIFLISETQDAGLLMKLMRIGVKEFLPLPMDTDEMQSAINRFKKRVVAGGHTPVEKNGRVISVAGSKGGVGTTTVAVNLAVSLLGNDRDTSVILFDMNTLYGEIPIFLDLTPKFHWGEITKNIDRLDDTFLMNILSRHASGVHLLPSPSYLNGNNSPSGEVIDRILSLMRTMFDYIVVDAGLPMEDASLRLLQQSDDVMLVSLLNMPCLSNTNRLMKSLTELGYVSKEQVKVVINRNLKKNELSVKDAESGIEKEIFCVIPNDYQTTMNAINQGKPIRQVAPKSLIAKKFQEITEHFSPRPETQKKRKWKLTNLSFFC